MHTFISKDEKVPFERPRAVPSSSYAPATKGVIYGTACWRRQGALVSSTGMNVEIMTLRGCGLSAGA